MNEVYCVETLKNFNDAVVSVLKAVDQKGWTVFQVYDIQERLSAKGFKHDSLKIIEICSAKHANKLLSKNKLVSLCMPCKINVFVEENKVFIALIEPSIAVELFEKIKKEDVEDIAMELREIVDSAR